MVGACLNLCAAALRQHKMLSLPIACICGVLYCKISVHVHVMCMLQPCMLHAWCVVLSR